MQREWRCLNYQNEAAALGERVSWGAFSFCLELPDFVEELRFFLYWVLIKKLFENCIFALPLWDAVSSKLHSRDSAYPKLLTNRCLILLLAAGGWELVSGELHTLHSICPHGCRFQCYSSPVIKLGVKCNPPVLPAWPGFSRMLLFPLLPPSLWASPFPFHAATASLSLSCPAVVPGGRWCLGIHNHAECTISILQPPPAHAFLSMSALPWAGKTQPLYIGRVN